MDFIKRHIGLSRKDEKYILNKLGYKSLDELISNTVPKNILLKDDKVDSVVIVSEAKQHPMKALKIIGKNKNKRRKFGKPTSCVL